MYTLLKEPLRKSLMKIYPRDSKKHTSSATETLTNFVSCCGNAFIHMSTWIVWKHSTKHRCQRKNSFKATKTMESTESITDASKKMLKESAKNFSLKNLGQCQNLHI